jgi:hypothetical protein
VNDVSTIIQRQHERTLLPRTATLEGFVDNLADTPGIRLRDVEPLTAIVVRTQNSCYRIVIGHDHTAIVRGGSFFCEPTPARIDGSGFGGTLLKVGWIGIGLRVEIFANGRRIITSPVREITVERTPSASVH